MKTRKEVGK